VDLNEKLVNAINESNKVFQGKEKQVKLAFISIISKGHLLIEDIPGVGKTTLVYLLSHIFGIQMSRIQFTNDLLPTDIIGTSIFDKVTSSFIFKRGPIFSPMVLADELNRASPKTQSALLQAMEERYITHDNCEYQLESPFIVIATQNPIDQIGTNPLPESQLDRFFMGLTLGLPSREFEKKIILGKNIREQIDSLHPFLDVDDLRSIGLSLEKITVEDSLVEFMINFLDKVRKELPEGKKISVRAGQDLFMGMKANAFIEKRNFVTHDDLLFIAPFIMSHRLNFREGFLFGQDVVSKILSDIPLR
jgi:MoxR-like ATPase